MFRLNESVVGCGTQGAAAQGGPARARGKRRFPPRGPNAPRGSRHPEQPQSCGGRLGNEGFYPELRQFLIPLSRAGQIRAEVLARSKLDFFFSSPFSLISSGHRASSWPRRKAGKRQIIFIAFNIKWSW